MAEWKLDWTEKEINWNEDCFVNCWHITGLNLTIDQLKTQFTKVLSLINDDNLNVEKTKNNVNKISSNNYITKEIKNLLENFNEILEEHKNNNELFSNNLLETIENLKKENDLLKRDQLTWLFNRHWLLEKFNNLLETKSEISIWIIDIDNFKSINDKYGHPVWDKVLKNIAQNILLNSFDIDSVYRFWWEEFIVIINWKKELLNKSLKEALLKLNKWVFKISEKEHVKITFSAWVTNFITWDDFKIIYERADKLLYKAKDSWKNQILLD